MDRTTKTLQDEALNRSGVVVHVVSGRRSGWLVLGKTGWITEGSVRRYQTDRAVREILEQVQSGRSFTTLNYLLFAWVVFSVFLCVKENAILALSVLFVGVVKLTGLRRGA